MESKAERLLGIDYGSKYVGVAYSEGLFSTGQWQFFEKEALTQIARLCHSHDITTCVVGLPEGSMVRRIREFAEKLRKTISCPVIEWDESLTSHEATQQLLAVGNSRRRRKDTEHQTAAAILLDAYLSAHKSIASAEV